MNFHYAKFILMKHKIWILQIQLFLTIFIYNFSYILPQK